MRGGAAGAGGSRSGSAGNEESLLVVEELVKHFPGGGGLFRRSGPPVRAVEGVSLRVGRGETLALVGESGCGKSTTARAILRLVEPTSGTVRFDGVEVGALEGRALARFRRRAQIVFQDPYGSLNPRLRVGAALEEPLRVHGLVPDRTGRRRRVGELLERVGLRSEHAGRYPHELSGGQRQRIGIARALATEPELLICDEPVSALDVSVQARILNLLAELQEELGVAYLFIAHDLAVVEHVADRVAVMYAGRIVETGPARGIYRRPLHPYTRALLSAIPRISDARSEPGEPAREVIPGDPPSTVESPSGCPFHPRCPHPAKDRECRMRIPDLEAMAPGHRAACVKASPGDAETPSGGERSASSGGAGSSA